MKFFLVCFYLIPIIAFSQIKEKFIGNVPVQNFAPKDYRGEPQVNCVTKDSRGVLYFGHNSGLSIFDGTDWAAVKVDDKSVQSIYISTNDRIFIGSEGQFGELVNNDKGLFEYVILSKEIEEKNEINTIFSINKIDNRVFFSDLNHLYILDENKNIEIITSEETVQETYVVGNTMYINLQKLGLYYLNKDNELTPYEGNESLIEKKINQVLPFGKDSILIVTSTHLYTSPKNKIDLNIEPFSLDNQFAYTTSHALGNQDFLIGLSSSGTARINSKFELLEIYNIENGLINNSLKSYCETLDGNIAVTTDNGISLIQYKSPIRTFNKNENIHGPMEAVFGQGDQVVVVGKEGVFYLDRAKQSSFTEVNNLNQVGFGGGYIDSLPFIVLYDGVFKLQNDSLYNVNYDIAWTVFQYDENHYLVGGENEFIIYHKNDNKDWAEIQRTPINSNAKTFFKDKNGSLWIGTYRGEGGLYYFEPEFNKNKNYNSGDLRYYNQDQIGADGDVYVFGKEGEPYFGTRKGILEFAKNEESFIPSVAYANLNGFEIPIATFDYNSNLWSLKVTNVSKRSLVYMDQNQVEHGEDFNLINENMIYGIYPENANDVWLAGPDGLFLYSFNNSNETPVFQTYFKGVSIGDSLVHSGNYKTNSGFSFTQLDPNQFVFPYAKTAVKFRFGATNYTDAKNTKFSYYLEGFDETWSAWTNDYNVQYTNIPEGKYTLKVKSINSSGVEGVPSEVKFEILPPWYRTWWFISIVVILVLAIFYLLFMLRTATLRKRQVELEQTIKERTAEVIEQKKEAETQRDLAQKEHQIAEEQKHLVEEKNQEISDSINYAERIQRAMLANEKIVQQYLKDYFIFFQPKDVVSGDFYWASILNNGNLALVNADSTGHGVPGAIMSMLNMNSLKESVSGKGLVIPHEILNNTRTIIKETLLNDGSAEGGKDGMDCSLMEFDLEHNKIRFAAANNPVWIVRNSELIEFKGDKMPVGKHDRDSETFTTQEFEVNKGDVIYTLTDGMPDQFGGPKGKKFMYKRLKNLLIEISTLPMNTQHDTLKKEMTEWMADEEQVDDVCIIGVRI